jgi:hypothetical protein
VRAPGVARVLFIGFFFSTRSSRILKSKNRPFSHKKQAGGRKHVLKTKTELTAHVFPYLGLYGGVLWSGVFQGLIIHELLVPRRGSSALGLGVCTAHRSCSSLL